MLLWDKYLNNGNMLVSKKCHIFSDKKPKYPRRF